MEDIINQDTSALVDRGYVLKVKIDTAEEEQDLIKAELKQRAKKEKAGYFLGSKHFSQISPTSSTVVDTEALHKVMKKLGQAKEFWNLVTAKVKDARDMLGETVFDTISKSDSFPYSKISFKEKVPKKYQ